MGGLFDNLIGDSPAFSALKRDAESGRLAHAYLLHAPDRLAGMLTAERFAAFALGDRFTAELVFQKKHPDVLELPAEGQSQIAAADIDAMLAGLFKTPSRGDKKFYILDRAETVSPLCQNKLLKTLEEPPPGVCMILNCQNLSKLLPTVASRCRRFDIRPFDPASIRAELMRYYKDTEKAELAAALSLGSLTAADAFMRETKTHARFMLALDVLANTKSSKDVLDAVSKLAGSKEPVAEILDFFELILRDAAVYAAGHKQLLFLSAYESEIGVLSSLYSAGAIERILPFLSKLRRRISLNANPNSLLDELMFTVAEYRAKYK